MKVLLDTNVIISAIATRGLCADVFRAVLSHHEFIVCPKILQEVRRVLQSKFAVPENLISEYLELISQDAVLVEAEESVSIAIKDRDDIEIISAAISANADIMVTGDSEVLSIKAISQLRILSPREFWKELKVPKK